MEQSASIEAPVVKAVSVWATVGITSWSDAAAFVAFLYSVVLLSEWFWKRFGRGFAERRGWIKPKQVQDEP